MSHILLKRVPNSTIVAPVSTEYIKFFCNDEQGGELYYMDSTGTQYSVGNKIKVNDVTYNQLYSLGLSSSFVTASYYLINDFESVYEQPDYYCDGSLKTSTHGATGGTLKGKPSAGAGWAYQPLLVQAISNSDLSEYAYQPTYTGAGEYRGFPKDKIKYDYTWNKTEFNHPAKGRITERIDEFGNKTDYDHRAIRFKRYQRYDKNTLLDGTITDYNSVTGIVSATGASFSVSLVAGDVIILDSLSDLGYNIGLKVDVINGDNEMIVMVDSLIGLTPSTVTLNNGAQIVPVNYNFTSKSYNFYTTTATGLYDQYKENYFGQSDEKDYNGEVYTFDSSSITTNNTIGNYSNLYLQEKPNGVLILSNNVFEGEAINNKIGDYSYNNHASSTFNDNNIGNYFAKNVMLDKFNDNNIGNNYIGNFIQPLATFEKNIIGNDFHDNVIKNSFTNNNIDNDFYGNIASSSFQQNRIGSKFYNNSISGIFLYNIIDFYFYSNTIDKEFQYNLINARFSDNNIKYIFNRNKIYYSFCKNITDAGKSKLGFINNIINYDVTEQDFTSSEYACSDFTCNIVKSYDTRLYIAYLKNGDTMSYVYPITE